METEDEKGDDEEEPGESEEEESDSEQNERKPASKSTRQTRVDESGEEVSWTEQVEVAPRTPLPAKADLVKVFTGGLMDVIIHSKTMLL